MEKDEHNQVTAFVGLVSSTASLSEAEITRLREQYQAVDVVHIVAMYGVHVLSQNGYVVPDELAIVLDQRRRDRLREVRADGDLERYRGFCAQYINARVDCWPALWTVATGTPMPEDLLLELKPCK